MSYLKETYEKVTKTTDTQVYFPIKNYPIGLAVKKMHMMKSLSTDHQKILLAFGHMMMLPVLIRLYQKKESH